MRKTPALPECAGNPLRPGHAPLDADAGLRPGELVTLRLRAPGGDTWVPAVALGELTLKPEFKSITRCNGERINEISGFLHPGTLPIEITRAVLLELENGTVTLPPGYRIETAGDNAEQRQAINQLLTYVSVLAALMISALLSLFFTPAAYLLIQRLRSLRTRELVSA